MCLWCSMDARDTGVDQPRTRIPESRRATVSRLVCWGCLSPQYYWYGAFVWWACRFDLRLQKSKFSPVKLILTLTCFVPLLKMCRFSHVNCSHTLAVMHAFHLCCPFPACLLCIARATSGLSNISENVAKHAFECAGKRQENSTTASTGGSGVNWDAPLAAFAPLQVSLLAD